MLQNPSPFLYCPNVFTESIPQSNPVPETLNPSTLLDSFKGAPIGTLKDSPALLQAFHSS